MILKLYVIRDEVSIENKVLLTAENVEVLRRNIKAVLLSPQPNYLNQNTKDKRVFYVGDLETETGVITALDPIISICSIEEVRLELIDEINIEKAKVAASKLSAAETFKVPVEALDEIDEVKPNA